MLKKSRLFFVLACLSSLTWACEWDDSQYNKFIGPNGNVKCAGACVYSGAIDQDTCVKQHGIWLDTTSCLVDGMLNEANSEVDCQAIGGKWKVETRCIANDSITCGETGGKWYDRKFYDMRDGNYLYQPDLNDASHLYCAPYDKIIELAAQYERTRDAAVLSGFACTDAQKSQYDDAIQYDLCLKDAQLCVVNAFPRASEAPEADPGKFASCSACEAGQAMCVINGEAKCTYLQTDEHCGRCNHSCAELSQESGKEYHCSDGECVTGRVCDFSYEGVCYDPTSDVTCGARVENGDLFYTPCDDSTGACDATTATPGCRECKEGFVNCGGRCIDPLSDDIYCGANARCERYTMCQNGMTCQQGECRCAADEAACGPDKKCEPLVKFNDEHCGAAPGGACNSDYSGSPDYQGKKCGEDQTCAYNQVEDKFECIEKQQKKRLCKKDDVTYIINENGQDNLKFCGVIDTDLSNEDLDCQKENPVDCSDIYAEQKGIVICNLISKQCGCVDGYKLVEDYPVEPKRRCVNTNNDIHECGNSMEDCASKNMVCVNGVCKAVTCYENEVKCGGQCLSKRALHIADCSTCEEGYCAKGADVTQGCFEPLGNNQNCGTCGNACQNGKICIDQNCVCPNNSFYVQKTYDEGTFCMDIARTHINKDYDGTTVTEKCLEGWADFDNTMSNGCEVNLNTNVHACGTEAIDCVTYFQNVEGIQCVNGKCQYERCLDGFMDCDDEQSVPGCETDILNDPENCSRCAKKCITDLSCVNGVCCAPTDKLLSIEITSNMCCSYPLNIPEMSNSNVYAYVLHLEKLLEDQLPVTGEIMYWLKNFFEGDKLSGEYYVCFQPKSVFTGFELVDPSEYSEP